MVFSQGITVLVFVLDQDSDLSLESWAELRGWSLAQPRSPEEAIQAVAHLQPQVIILQFSNRLVEALEVLANLRNGFTQIPLITITSCHHSKVERAVREAGASCYFSGTGSMEMVDQAVSKMLMKSSLKPGAKPTVLPEEYAETNRTD